MQPQVKIRLVAHNGIYFQFKYKEKVTLERISSPWFKHLKINLKRDVHITEASSVLVKLSGLY